jgi:hypothetical protein
MSTILFHRSDGVSLLDLHTNFDERLAEFRRLNADLRKELEVAVEHDRRAGLLVAEYEEVTP